MKLVDQKLVTVVENDSCIVQRCVCIFVAKNFHFNFHILYSIDPLFSEIVIAKGFSFSC